MHDKNGMHIAWKNLLSKNTLSVNFIGPDSDHIQNLFSVFEKIEKKGTAYTNTSDTGEGFGRYHNGIRRLSKYLRKKT